MTLGCFRGAENKWLQGIAEDIIVVCPELTVSCFFGRKSAKGTDTVGKGLEVWCVTHNFAFLVEGRVGF